MKNNIKVTPLQVKGDVVPENRAEIESTIRKSLDTVVASDSVEVTTHQIDLLNIHSYYMGGLYQKVVCCPCKLFSTIMTLDVVQVELKKAVTKLDIPGFHV